MINLNYKDNFMTSGLLGHNTKKHSTLLSPKLTYFHIVKRSMMSRLFGNNAAAGRIAHVGRVSITKRSVCLMVGVPKKKLPVTVADGSGYHKVITETTCNDAKCLQRNCATDPECPVKRDTATGHGDTEAITRLVGNMTGKAPANLSGGVINKYKNYNGDNKPQEMVLEPTMPVINTEDFKINVKATAYAQQQKNHEAIMSLVHPNKNDTQ